MGRGRDAEFEAFVAVRYSALLRLACLFCAGDVHRAEDLVQEALVRLWAAWPRARDGSPEAYARQVLARRAAREARRLWWGERPTGQLPEVPMTGDMTEAVSERERLDAALGCLPPKQRTVVVLRYYEDLTDRQVAEVLGCPLGTVRSQTSRGVARLRTVLADAGQQVG